MQTGLAQQMNRAPKAFSEREFASADMEPLVGRVREFLGERKGKITSFDATYDLSVLCERFDYRADTREKRDHPGIVLQDEVAVELGHPSTPSRAVVLTCQRSGLVRHGRISIVGPDLDSMPEGHRIPFAQVVLLALWPGTRPDPLGIDKTQFLMHRLPGYMVRSVPARLWVRVSKAARAAGMTLRTVGSALINAYKRDFEGEVQAVEVVFVTSSAGDVEALAPIAAEANILAGRHKKLVLGGDGEVECRKLNCEPCEERSVCDSLRDIVIKRRSRTK